MGTSYSVKYRHNIDRLSPQLLHREIEGLLATINKTMSTYDPDSELSRFNSARTTDWVPVSTSLFTVLKAALEINAQSDGAYDVTVGPLVNLWGFGPEIRPERIPDEIEIISMRAQTGQDKLILHETSSTIRKTRADLFVDLSGIAKGYGVDQVAEMMESHGIKHYMIEIGGEIRARGINAQGVPWQIGIEKPLAGGRPLHKVLALNNTALATSGNYRNFFEIAGRRYIHIIDPTTGWPIENDLASVTVMSDSCMLADAWATALQVLGFERGMAIAENLGMPVLFIVNRNGVFEEHASSSFQLESAQDFLVILIASFFIIGIAIMAMAIGVMAGRKPLGGSCGGLGRIGLKCDAGCDKPCPKRLAQMAPGNKPPHQNDL